MIRERQFCPCVNIVECAYTKLDAIAYYTPTHCHHTWAPSNETLFAAHDCIEDDSLLQKKRKTIQA